MKKIGFVGIGVMGSAMALNLMKNGFELAVYTRTKATAEPVVAAGAQWCANVAACAAGRDAVITMVGFPQEVREIYFADGGILQNAQPGSILIDMSTNDPALSLEIYEAAKQKGLQALDAPVSGSDVGARDGTLSIMAGGDEDAFEACLPLFNAMGRTILYEGGAGAGQHTKMCNQIALAGIIASLCEALAYAKSAGLNPSTMLDTVSQGAAGSWQMSNMGPRILKGDLAPGFYIKHYIKDLNIAMKNAQNNGNTLGIAETVLNTYRQLDADGCGDLGTQALIKHYIGQEKP